MDLLPIRLTKIRSACNDDGSQALVAHQSKVAGVGDLLLPLLMTGGTVHLEDLVALLSGADGAGRVWRHVMHLLVRVSPSRTHATNECVHLLRREESACRLTEGGHLGSGHARGDPAPQRCVIHQCLIVRIGQIERWPPGTVFAMAGRAILLVETIKRHYFLGPHEFFLVIRRPDSPMAPHAARDQDEGDERQNCITPSIHHSPSFGDLNSLASIPMRRMKGRV